MLQCKAGLNCLQLPSSEYRAVVRFGLIAFALGLALIVATKASAQSDSVIIAEPLGGLAALNETYDESKVSTGVFLGYRIGGFAGSGSLDAMYVGLPAMRSDIVCVSIKTRDARYSALNRYSLEQNPKGYSRIQLRPVTRSYRKELRTYASSDFAVNTFLPDGEKCIQSDAVHYPQIGRGISGASKLQILINSESRSGTIEIVSVGDGSEVSSAQSAKSPCVDLSDRASVAFDKSCELPVSDDLYGRVIAVRISLNDGFELEPYVFKLYVLDPSQAQ